MDHIDTLQEGVRTTEQIDLDGIRRSFSGAYEIHSLIGRGGMGNVYLGSPCGAPSERMAIKVLHPEFCGDETLLARFQREAELMKRIDHPGVVRIYDAGKRGNSIFYAMEFVQGVDLDEMLEARRFDLDALPELTINICDALNAIHAVGIIHRDLKPANIMVLDNGSVKLTDFGIARPENSQLTHHNEIVGSVCYIAPEIWIGEQPTESVDLYSLGILLYEIVTGEVPFDGASPGELMRKHLQSKPVEPITLNENCPLAFNSLILALLSKEKKDRPATANSIIAKLKREISRTQEVKTFVAFQHDTQEFLHALDTSATVAKVSREVAEEFASRTPETTRSPMVSEGGRGDSQVKGDTTKILVLIVLVAIATVSVASLLLIY